MSQVVFWTHRIGSVFNIVHVHLNDRSEDTTIDVEYIKNKEYDLREINFGKD